MVEEECPFLVPILKELAKDASIDIFSLFGDLLVNIPLDDDEDESQEGFAAPEVPSEVGIETPRSIKADMWVEVEESFSQLAHNPAPLEHLSTSISSTVLIKGQEVSKA